MTVATGPKASISCTAEAVAAASQWRSTGFRKAPTSASPETSVARAGSPTTISASAASSAMRECTSSRCARLASGPMRTASSRGSPTAVSPSRAPRAAITASAWRRGTITRRIAVHFWPHLVTISRATSRTNRSNSGVSGCASLPSTAQLRLSASIVKRVACSITVGCARSLRPVAAEPVNVTTSWAPT